MTLTAPIKWHGGKNAFQGKLARWIIGLMPVHTHYVEPYFGGGAVLLNKGFKGISEVANDLNSDLMVFWAVLRSYEWFERFQRCVEAIPFSEAMFEAAAVNISPDMNTAEQLTHASVNRAVQFFVRARQSRQGLMKDFATLSRNRTRRGMNEQVSSWLSAVEGLPEVHARLSRVVILNRNALDVIIQQDGPNTLFYLDPPYLHETRSTKGEYKHEMLREDHESLLEVLSGIEGKFVLSGYRSELYDRIACLNSWERHEFPIVNNASSKARKDVKVECVWVNY